MIINNVDTSYYSRKRIHDTHYTNYQFDSKVPQLYSDANFKTKYPHPISLDSQS